MDRPSGRFKIYCEDLNALLHRIEATDEKGGCIDLDHALDRTIQMARAATAANRRVLLVGNGGSAAIASHAAIDFIKSGIRAGVFNDPAALTCLANDFGYAAVFARQIALHAGRGDLLFAISSSGESQNILLAIDEARRRGCYVVTLSGFSRGNSVRRTGDVNFHVPFSNYGHVELSHFCLCHAIVDFACGAWSVDEVEKAYSELKSFA